ncbi:hypothetical protein CYY_006481 [Polysphondylium violaceum]|uniref:NB-ARC domain-containing protein n=1 Tax=Polysphondylium violaceum TaxID=133409 RepID=A0A8J4PSL4_9MYCE|nr:hypothetical protein CYY_006481 [Polysphondylium violaceum]
MIFFASRYADIDQDGHCQDGQHMLPTSQECFSRAISTPRRSSFLNISVNQSSSTPLSILSASSLHSSNAEIGALTLYFSKIIPLLVQYNIALTEVSMKNFIHKDIQTPLGNVILIYDNVEDMSLIREKPQGNHINILITTRSQVCDDPLSNLIPLDLLNQNKCKSLFKLWRPNISDTHIAELSRILQRLPLAISHCLAYMDLEGIEEDQYIKEFEMFNEIQVIGDDSFH